MICDDLFLLGALLAEVYREISRKTRLVYCPDLEAATSDHRTDDWKWAEARIEHGLLDAKQAGPTSLKPMIEYLQSFKPLVSADLANRLEMVLQSTFSYEAAGIIPTKPS